MEVGSALYPILVAAAVLVAGTAVAANGRPTASGRMRAKLPGTILPPRPAWAPQDAAPRADPQADAHLSGRFHTPDDPVGENARERARAYLAPVAAAQHLNLSHLLTTAINGSCE